MARQIDLVATTDGAHYLVFGINNNELASFAIQIWITHYGKRAIDWAQSMSLNYITFMGGDLWVHNSDSTPRCLLYGEEKDCVVGVVTNEEPTKVKLFDSVGIHSDGAWEIYEITVPADASHPNGMYSKIPFERFKRRDGVWRAEFLRNMKSTSDTASAIQAIMGEPMSGYAAYMVLRNVNNPTGEQIKLFKVTVNATKKRGQ